MRFVQAHELVHRGARELRRVKVQVELLDAARLGEPELQPRDENGVGVRVVDRPPLAVERRPALARDEEGPRPEVGLGDGDADGDGEGPEEADEGGGSG